MEKKLFFSIIIISLLVRLYHIDFTIMGWHSWRQADTAAIARNFFENGFKFLYPQIDWGGNSQGIVETEFPVYPFLVSILYLVFGVHDWLGRLVSVIFSMITIYGFYILVKKYTSINVALWSTFIYSVLPLNIYYSRTFMPESMLLMCSVLGIYFFSQWIDNSKTKDYFTSIVFISLAILIKIPTLYIGLPLLYLSILKFGRSTFKNKMLWLYAFLVIFPSVLWYYHAHQLYVQYGHTFGIWGFGKDKWGNFELLLTLKFYNDVFFKSIAERHFTYFGFIPFLLGLFEPRNNSRERVFDFWLLSVIIYFLIVTRGNQIHEYYQLPFVLPGVVYIGKVYAKYIDLRKFRLSYLNNRSYFLFLSVCLVGILILSFFRYERFMRSETNNSYIFRLVKVVQNLTYKCDLIISANENPVILYLCHRKGWRCSVDQLDKEYIYSKIQEGAKYLIIEKNSVNTIDREKRLKELMGTFKVVYYDEDFVILELSKQLLAPSFFIPK